MTSCNALDSPSPLEDPEPMTASREAVRLVTTVVISRILAGLKCTPPNSERCSATCSSVGLLAVRCASSAWALRILLYADCTRDGSRIVRVCSCSVRLMAARTQKVA